MNFSHLSFGYFSLKIFGILAAIAFVIAAWKYYKEVQKRKFSVDFFVHHFWRWLLGGVFLGRIMALLLDPSIIVRHSWGAFFAFWDGEIYIFGVIAGFLATMILDLKSNKKPFWEWLDLMVYPSLIGILIIDISIFLTGAIYGTPTSLPWGVQYETFGVATLEPVHPVSLYAFFIHAFLLRWVLRHINPYKNVAGKLALKFAFYFYSFEFVLQFFRGDITTMIGPFRLEQLLSVVAVFVIGYFIRARKINQ